LKRRRPLLRAAGRLSAWCAICAGCGSGAPDVPGQPDDAGGRRGELDSIVVIDAEDRRLALPAPARRIVSLVPSATATLRAIGAGQTLVARTDFDRAEWAAGLPSVGGGLEPSLETIVALQPDLVVRFGGEQDPRTRARLEELSIPFLSVRPDGLADIFRTAELLGAVTGRISAADSLVRSLRDGLGKASEAVATLPPVRVAYVLGGSPPWVAGPGTYIDEVLSLIGGSNVFADLGALYSAVSVEELRTRAIDVVLVSAPGQYDETLTPDARTVVIGDALDIPGPDVVEAALRVAELLHGRPLR
jgi:iron complex transport system substrate-binding protein